MGAVQKSAEHHDGLFEAPQRPTPLTRADSAAALPQQVRQVQHGLPTDVEHGGVGDTGRQVKPLA